MDERGQFTFYASIFASASRIRSKAARADFYDAICNYALNGIEPDLDALSDAGAIGFISAKPNLDSSRRKAKSGSKGGKCKQTESKPEANGKQTASEKEKEREKEKEIENECYIGADSPAVISLPLNDSTEFPVTQQMLTEFSDLYPAVDVMQEMRNMRGWLLNNPKNRKTRSGIRRFINSWLSREQDKGRRPATQPAYTHGADRLAAMIGRGDFDD